MAKVKARVAKLRPFRNKVRVLLKRTPSTLPDKRCMNLQEFVERLHCDYYDFSKKINGHIAMTREEVEAVVEEFAKLETIKTRSDARELFALKDVYDIHPDYWNKPVFEKLDNDDPLKSDKLKEEPTLATEQVGEKTSTKAPAHKKKFSLWKWLSGEVSGEDAGAVWGLIILIIVIVVIVVVVGWIILHIS
jgi:hypothetical protein